MDDLGLDLLMNKRKRAGSDNSDSVKSLNVIDVGEHFRKQTSSYPASSSYGDGDDEDEDDEENMDEFADEPPRPPPIVSGTRNVRRDRDDNGSVVSFGQTSQRSLSHAGRFRPVHPLHSSEADAALVAQKKELLYQFDRMEKKGMVLPRKFTLSSNLEDMKSEFDRLKRDKEIDSSIKMQRRIMMAAASGMEWLNNKFDPVGAKLDGWSDSLYENITDYDDVFEELHDKYKTSTQLPPEIKLLMMLSGSAFMHHMTHTMFKTQLPGLDEILKQNPDLAKNLAAATSEHMAHQQSSAGNLFGSLGGMFQGMFGGGGPSSASQPPAPPPPPAAATGGGMMKGPANVDDIMREFAAMNPPSSEEDVAPSERQQDELDVLERLADVEAAAIVQDATSSVVENGGKRTMTLDI